MLTKRIREEKLSRDFRTGQEQTEMQKAMKARGPDDRSRYMVVPNEGEAAFIFGDGII